MTKVDIISGFLGAGKTTLIKKLLKEVYANQQVVLIEYRWRFSERSRYQYYRDEFRMYLLLSGR